MRQLPESVLPELRAKWVRLSGAKEVVQHAAQAMQRMDDDYQSTLAVALRMMEMDPAVNWRVNLETGELSEVTAEDVLRQNGVPQTVG